MSTSTLLNPGQTRQSSGATPVPSRPTFSHASAGSMDGAFQKAIQQYMKKLPDDDKTAFLSAPDVIEHLEKLQCNDKSLISSSLTTRVEKVLQCVKGFMGSLGIFIQHSPEISSLVVGGVNCILTVGTTIQAVPTLLFIYTWLIYFY